MKTRNLNIIKLWHKSINAISCLPKKILLCFHYQFIVVDYNENYEQTIIAQSTVNRYSEAWYLILYGFYSAIYYVLTVYTIWTSHNVQPIAFILWVITILLIAIEHLLHAIAGYRVNKQFRYIHGIKHFHFEVYSKAIILHFGMLVLIILTYIMCLQMGNYVYVYAHPFLKLLICLSGFCIWGDSFVRKLAEFYNATDVY